MVVKVATTITTTTTTEEQVAYIFLHLLTFAKPKLFPDHEESILSLTFKAFEVCDKDDQEGLTWDEIEKCEKQFCGLLSLTCPSKENFGRYDLDGDGNLTLEEFLQVFN